MFDTLTHPAVLAAFIGAGVSAVYAVMSRRESRRAFVHASNAAAHAAESFRHANRAGDKAKAAELFADKAKAAAAPEATAARPLGTFTILSDAGPVTVRLSEVPMVGLAAIDETC